ncbi:MAG: hypothetical protein NTZ67_02935 [Gammaproteobacteria bacterium]|nr:hypothetical protein [Gammaproteobacteria bacterium]
MRTTKKTTHYLIILLTFLLGVLFYNLFFDESNKVMPDHGTLTITPFTAKEQKDLIQAQQAETRTVNTGPLVATATAMNAQAKVLNLKHQA